jgi:23S rRNA (uracil1939-C5)-methyltransferase
MPETLVTPGACLHFGVCGGCAVPPGGAPPPYEQQLAEKEARVRALLSPFDIAQWLPIIPSPDLWHYRNKMEFAFAVAADTPDMVLGLRQSGRYDRVVDLQTCFLTSPEAVEILQRVRAWAKAHGLSGYHRKQHVGDLRYLVVRDGKNTGQRMVVLLASKPTDGDSKLEAAIPALREAIESLVTTAWLGVTDLRTDVARTDDMRLLWGPGTIEERLGDIRYQISPYSFFQTNTHGTERLYGLLAAWGAMQGGALLDLYCGSGGITLALAKSFDRVVGVDSNRDAIEDARANAERNGLGNTEFVCGDALDFVKKLPGSKLSIQLSALIVDPPRPGLHPKAMEALLDINSPRLAYVSCNPESLARDLKSLASLYRFISAQPVDLFPHTAHVETVVFMEHR